MSLVSNVVRLSHLFNLKGPSGVEDQAEFSTWWAFDDAHLPSDWNGDLQAFATGAYAAWAAHADDSVFRTSVELNSVKAAHLNASMHTQHEQEHTPSTKWAGTSTAASLPWQVSLCIGLYTYTPGSFIPDARTRRGRIYLPPMTSAVLDIPTKGTLSDSRVADTLTWINDMVLAIAAIELPSTGQGLAPGVVSRYLNKVKRSTPTFNVLTDFAADGVLDSQRRRTHQEIKVRSQRQYSA